MIKLIDILKEITEGKQVGTLYHYTTFQNAVEILSKNCLHTRTYGISSPYGKEVISFTRNKNFHDINKLFWFRVAGNREVNVRLALDGNKLSNTYHLEPTRDQWVFNSDNPRSKWSKTPKVIKKSKKYYSADESEERLITNKMCIPIKDYLLEIGLFNLNITNTNAVESFIPQEFHSLLKII